MVLPFNTPDWPSLSRRDKPLDGHGYGAMPLRSSDMREQEAVLLNPNAAAQKQEGGKGIA
jgi:hypothetical protein